MVDEYRDLLDTEVILPGDEYESCAGDWYPVVSTHYQTPREVNGNNLFCRRYRRPIPAKPAPTPPSKPAIDPGEGYRLMSDHEVLRGTDHHTLNGGWWACYGYIGMTVAEIKKQLLPSHTLFRRRIHEVAEPTLNDLHRAYIHRHPSPDDDVLPSMRYAIVCPDGVRRHAATWDEAVAVLDDAVRRECERKGGQS